MLTILAVVALARACVVLRARIRAENMMVTYVSRDLETGALPWDGMRNEFDACGSFIGQFFDLRKWTFRQFYPCFAGK